MFSGIVEELGIVNKIEKATNLSTLKVRVHKNFNGIKKGDSIAVDGVCLTVTNIRDRILSFDVMKETLLKTTLGKLESDDQVNLERALKVDARINGHFVTGHIDDVGLIKAKQTQKNYTELHIGIKKRLARYIVPKGSICVDGISLTVGEVKKDHFTVYLIPLTKQMTTLGQKKKGDFVNIETDLLAKYILNAK